MNDFLEHLKDVHKLVVDTEHLAPLGLAICPLCNGVFAALRGWEKHVGLCKFPQKAVCDLVEGPFPRACRVWWIAESKWFDGQASPSEFPYCWEVAYNDGSFETEQCYRVVFSPDSSSLVDLNADASRVSLVSSVSVVPPGLSEAKQSTGFAPNNTSTSDNTSLVSLFPVGSDFAGMVSDHTVEKEGESGEKERVVFLEGQRKGNEKEMGCVR